MHTIRGLDVGICFQEALWLMKVAGVDRPSRNGKVKRLLEPVCITYENPMKRVLFNPKRDANPFFHLMEALWMLGGRHDVAFVANYASNMKNYSDDGKILHGAYGHRWIYHFNFNQLGHIAEELRRDPASRRCVLQMWDATEDWPAILKGGKDVPCNTHAYFELDEGKLNLTVCNRSNDLVWGALGANAVQFSFLLEWMAWRIEAQVGVYHQITNNLHIYESLWWMLNDASALGVQAEYPEYPVPLVNSRVSYRLFDIELARFLDKEEHSLGDYYAVPFLNYVAKPIACAWQTRKSKKGTGMVDLSAAADSDWKTACQQWIERRDLVSKSA